MVVDQSYVGVGGFLVRVRNLYSFPDLALDFFVRPVLRNQVLKLESQESNKRSAEGPRRRGNGTHQLEESDLFPELGVPTQAHELGFTESSFDQSTRGVFR